jgi:hypothetical protein
MSKKTWINMDKWLSLHQMAGYPILAGTSIGDVYKQSDDHPKVLVIWTLKPGNTGVLFHSHVVHGEKLTKLCFC